MPMDAYRKGDQFVVHFDLPGVEATLNPAEITAVQWALPVPVVGDAGVNEPYAVDLIIDDIRFVEAQ